MDGGKVLPEQFLSQAKVLKKFGSPQIHPIGAGVQNPEINLYKKVLKNFGNRTICGGIGGDLPTGKLGRNLFPLFKKKVPFSLFRKKGLPTTGTMGGFKKSSILGGI